MRDWVKYLLVGCAVCYVYENYIKDKIKKWFALQTYYIMKGEEKYEEWNW